MRILYSITMSSPRLSLLLMALLFCCCWSQNSKCTIWEAKDYRDCTCGEEFLDYELHCQNDHTYFETTLHQDTLSCDFRCANGGTTIDLGHAHYYCRCRPGTYGDCCERGKKIIIMMLQSSCRTTSIVHNSNKKKRT